MKLNVQNLKPTPVYDAFWRFAEERQKAFFSRLKGAEAPWTKDRIIANYKFTNVYRILDRTSQYLTSRVIYSGDQSYSEVFFRTILFKLFNKIETWEHLIHHFGEVTYREYNRDLYCKILMQLKTRGYKIYSAAYIMPMAKNLLGDSLKHESHLTLLEKMMKDRVPDRIAEARRMRDVYNLLLTYKGIGKFLAFQYTIDLNYSLITNFDESDFVIAGPGSLDGIAKCFSNANIIPPESVIKLISDIQDVEFHNRNLMFEKIGKRSLKLIDIQNLFCEISKYARLAYPNIKGNNNRVKIKQLFKPRIEPIECRFPPKWGIDNFPSRGSNGNSLFK